METIKNENQIYNSEKKPVEKHKLGFFVAAMVILTIFLSAAFGALFGFMASKSSQKILAGLRGGKLSALLNSNANESGVVKQKIVQEDSAVIDVVKEAAPAVVSIVISKDIPKIKNYGNLPDWFQFYFGQGNDTQDNGSGTEKKTIGGGTGFFITNDGMIVTNKHVVEDTAASYTVVTNDGNNHDAKVMAIDPVNDIAIIKIEGSGYPILSLGDSDAVQIGQTVIAIGNSLGEFSNTVSRGIISGLQRNLTAGSDFGQSEKLNNIIQTDAAINPGNSGGPLLDINGEVIGINVAIAQNAQNIGFAIPSNQVKKVVDQVKATGKISTPFMGVRYLAINDTLQKNNSLPYNYGELVVRGEKVTDFAVIPGSPADKAGISENDIILEIDGEKLDGKNGNSLSEIIAQHNVGDTLNLKVWHKGEAKEVKVKLEERK
jgi:S1-C subfamily serine protease